ncbi:MAG: EAL domain-containing protein [Rhodocyclaceae bacterium]|nr:EAL domain-containing protein [Rhodocyclaceae bacterium]
MHVLIVDTSRVFHHLMAEVFSQIGVKPITVTSLAEARSVLETQPISYVCCALHLQDGSGMDLCRSLRRLPNHVFTPFLLLTADTPSGLRQEAFLAGVTDIFEKSQLPSLLLFLRRLARQYEPATGQVLLVEDSPSQAEYYAAALESVGLTVDVTYDGTSGLDYLRQFNYDLLVTDMVLPGEFSGLALVNQVRRLSGDTGDIPILALTAFDDAARRVELFYLGVNDYVAKPALPEELVARARSLIQTSRALRDVRSRFRSAQSEIAFRVTHDPVTDLFNRWHFETLLTEGLASDAEPRSLAFIDLTCLKLVNDACGREAGDLLLRETGDALSAHFQKAACGHMEGARFAVLIPEEAQGAPASEQVTDFLRVLEQAPFTWQGKRFDLTAHAGLLSPLNTAGSAAEALSMADSACRAASQHSFPSVERYDRDEQSASDHERKRIITPLLEALQNRQFVLYRQPLVATRPGQKDGCEVLIRMLGADGSLIPPGLFLPAAELYGIIPRIDRWVTSRALEWLGTETPPPFDFVSINLSGLTLTDAGFGAFVRDELERTGAAPSAVQFEITETAVIGDMGAAHRLMDEVRGLGCRFALDDFGSGLSSLAQLSSLKVDMVKIDGQFVRHLLDNPVNQAIVRSVRDVATAAGMVLTAEFVETEDQARLLTDMGVDYLQGYAFGRPEPLEVCLMARPQTPTSRP